MAYTISAECTGCAHCTQWCPTGAIFGRRKVRFSIDGSRCVECGACGRICTFGAVITPTGEMAIRIRLTEWPKPEWNYAICNRCEDCIKACPTRCVQLAGRDEPEKALGAGFPFLARVKLCIGCGFCSRDCALQAISLTTANLSLGQ